MPQGFSVRIDREKNGYYIAWVPQLPGCHTQGKTLNELMKNIGEAVGLYLDVNKKAGKFLKI